MKIAIVVVAQDVDVLAFFDKRKGAVVPSELRKKINQFNPLPVHATCSDDNMIQILLDAHKKHDAVGVLIENGYEGRLKYCCDAVFIKSFDPGAAKANMHNHFGHNLNIWLKNLLFLSREFEDGKQIKCLLLPGQNFSAPDLDRIFELCRTQGDGRNFSEILQYLLKEIRKRNVPKKNKSGNKHFLRDDNDRFFELGKERHGKAETRSPPHASECRLTASARFGVTIDRCVHFNVSHKVGKISGEFKDCHGMCVPVSPCTHVNMFPNGFIR